LHVVTHEIVVKAKQEGVNIFLGSDFHFGSAYLDEERLKQDLDRAVRLNAPIAINGDLFDGHNHKHKHYRPGSMHPRLEASANPYNAALDIAVETLSPYAKQIIGIGCGNHDDNVAKWNGVDLIPLLIGILNREHGGNIQYMGYAGWLVFNLKYGTSCKPVKVNYHHGAGGSAPVTKGAITFSRADMWLDGADVIWRGHNHQVQTGKARVQRLNARYEIEHYDRLHIRSGSYLDTYRQQKDLTNGRMASYAEDWDSAPLPKGGVFLNAVYDDHAASKGIDSLTLRAEI
jgi:hypothetical protein